jgi:electron transfer flavoprotein alpha subunit
MIEVNRKGEVWIFAEQEAGKLSEVPLELMSKGRSLADKLGVPLAAALLGKNVREMSAKLIGHGADKVYVAQNDLLNVYQATSYSKTLCGLITQYKPQVVMYAATAIGRDLAPHVASAMKAGLTADCTDLQIGDHNPANTTEHYENLLLQIRPAFGGNIIATIVNYDRWPQMATVREGVMPLTTFDPKRKGEIVDCTANLNGLVLPLQVIESQRREKKVNLKAARIIVAGGAGVGSKDNFKLLWDLANCLGAAVGGSRAAVDLGYIDHDHQVGQTGTTVRPALYIAAGISGAVQHRAGMENSAKIMAINTDKSAPIFGVAHYGIVGDFKVIIPKMIQAIRSGAGAK